MKKSVYIFLLFILSLLPSITLSNNREWTYYTADDGLAGNSIWFIQEDQRGYLWLITVFDGATRYDGGRFQTLNTIHGLVSNNIYFILPDGRGNLWLATDRGVSKFNGKQFQNFTAEDGLAGNTVTFLIEDKKGNIWFATDGGISKYDGKKFQTIKSKSKTEDSAVNYILRDSRGNLWFGTENGLLTYEGNSLIPASIPNFSQSIHLISEDKQKNLWITTDSGLYRIRAENSTLEGPLLEKKINHIVEDRSSKLWFGSDANELFGYDASRQKFIPQKGFEGNSILSLLVDSRGQLWIGTEKSICKYNGKEFKNLTEIDGNILSYVRAIWEDMDANIWFGTENGVYKFTMQNLQHFTIDDNLGDNKVKTIFEDNEDNLWFGTESGLTKFSGGVFQNCLLGDEPADNNILSIHQDLKGNLWTGTTSGLFKNLQPVGEIELKIASAVRAIEEDSSGNLWFATADGITRFDGSVPQNFPIEEGREIFLDSKGNLWIGSWNSGIYKYEEGDTLIQFSMKDGLGSNHITWILEALDGSFWFGLKGGIPELESELIPRGGISHYNNLFFKNFSIEDGLKSEIISVAVEDTIENLWFGTDKGVLKYDIRSGNDTTAFTSLTKKDGLISNLVTAILLDRSGHFWFGTDKGFSKYDGENFQNIPIEKSTPYGVIESIFEDSGGNLWFLSTADGVYRYTPPSKEIKPRIHLEQIEADKIYYAGTEEIRIPKTTRRISFEYKAISFNTEPEKMRYTYKLDEFDPEWSPSTNATRVHYTDIKPGHYQFKVRAIDGDLRYSDPPVTVNFSVYQPFYQSVEFLLIVLLLITSSVGGAGYLITQLRKQKKIANQYQEKLRLQQEAERIQTGKMESLRQLVAGMAHEINNPIGAISSNNDVYVRAISKIRDMFAANVIAADNDKLSKTITMLEDLTASNRIASEKIAKIVANLRSFVRLDEAEWQTADIHECLESVITLIEPELMGKILIKKEYGNIPQIYCSPRNLNQVFLSTLRNARDAIEEQGEIIIRTFAEGGNIKVEIIDNGRGIAKENLDKIFDPGFTTKGVKVGVGLGLSICYQIIVEEHRGHIDVVSELGKGSSFIITLPQLKEETI